MRVAFEFTVPLFSSVTATRTWQVATVMCDRLRLTPKEIFALVQRAIKPDPRGSMNTVLLIAQYLKELSEDQPVIIVWGVVLRHALPVDVDIVVPIDFEKGIVYTDKHEFLFHTIINRYDDGKDWGVEFVRSLEG